MKLSHTFVKYFETLQDPRLHNHNFRHNFYDILAIVIIATIGGAENWVHIVHFAQARQDWLETFLELPNGIPSHDTFARVFRLIESDEFERCFFAWIESLKLDMNQKHIALDGKTLRGSRGQKHKALHLVSAWSSEHQLMLGQVRTEEKSNEIKAIPELLNMLDITGSLVTIDAMGCQKKIADLIRAKEADYILTLKSNQKTLYDDVSHIFEKAESIQYKKILHLTRVEKIKGHGRSERRKYTLISARDNSGFGLRWPGLRGLGKVEVRRQANGKTSQHTRYFLTSLGYEQILDFMEGVRKHWDIEINLHWSLDVSFKEDLNRTRSEYGAENLSIVRRLALNLLKHEKSLKIGIAAKRKRAGWDNEYMMKVFNTDVTI